MTRKEFLEQAAKQVNFQNLEDTRENALNRIRNRFGITTDVDFLMDFFHENGFKGGSLGFSRYEKKSNDILRITFSCMPWTTCFWEDIAQYVSMVVYINGCTFNHSGRHIEEFYLSEDGRFWDKKHNLRFENEDGLFDYLLTVEYDFHPVITERTYEMLRHFGWYEGRRVDTTDFVRELKNHGIILSQIQLDAISEFSGLEFSFSQSSRNQEFLTLEGIIQLIVGGIRIIFNRRFMIVTIIAYLLEKMFWQLAGTIRASSRFPRMEKYLRQGDMNPLEEQRWNIFITLGKIYLRT